MRDPGDSLEGVYINLDRAVERRAAMEKQLAEIGLPYPVERFTAIDGRLQPGCPDGLLPGQYGCWLSHLRALERSLRSERHLCVMEDDALISTALAILPDMVQSLDSGSSGEWDILYLDATLVELEDMYRMFEWVQQARPKSLAHLRRIPAEFTVYGTHSYIVNSSRKKYVHDFLRSYLDAGVPIDNVFASGIQKSQLKAYLTAPFLTSGDDRGLVSTLGYEGGENFLAWLLFRRLCFFDLSEDAEAGLAERVADLTRGVPLPEASFGALCAHRAAKWPITRFTPRVERN
jgi:GR25 family glycosyltransferase involved in LPS biosynthesis